MSNFQLSEQRIWPGCLEIELEGELDFQVSQRLREALEAAAEEPCHVLVSFVSCDFVDSGGLAVLVNADRDFAARDRQLLLYGMRGEVRRLFELVGMTEGSERWSPPWDSSLAGPSAGRDPGPAGVNQRDPGTEATMPGVPVPTPSSLLVERRSAPARR